MSLATNGFSAFDCNPNESQSKSEKQSDSTIASALADIQKILLRRMSFYVINDIASPVVGRISKLYEELRGMQNLLYDRNVNKFTEVYGKNVDIIERLTDCVVCRQNESRRLVKADLNALLAAWDVVVRRFRRVLTARNQAERLENFI